MLRLQLTIFLLTIFFPLSAQYSVEGKVLDASGKQALAFVNIGIVGTENTTSSDIDGKFKLTSSEPILGIVFTYVGYESYKHSPEKQNEYVVIKLQKKTFDLNTVIIRPGENPAHRIIKLATKNRDKNNPDKIQSYTCNTYSKTYWDLVYNTDEVKDKKDSVETDSLKSRLRVYSENSHMLMMEDVKERMFLYPENLNEKVVANKISGFKDPSFTLSSSDLQPFSFYDDYFQILGKDYLSPISGGSTSKYFFTIEDTLLVGNDSVYIISYRPFKGKNFEALEGVLYISTNGYAIQNVIAAPYEKSLVDVKIQQQYKLIEKQWFPEQLNYELHYKKYPTKYIGMKLVGKSYISDVKLNADLKKKDFGFETLVIEPGATRKDKSYWEEHRIDTLDSKEQKTYKVIDSLGKKQNFDAVLKVFEGLTTLQIPIGPISVDLNKFLGFNDYEIIRGGIGLHTNDKLTKWGNVGGYIAYGYADSITKFGFDAKVFLKKNSRDYFIKALYSKDISEPGKTQYFYTKYNFNRNQMTSRMDYLEQKEVSVNFRAFKYLTTNIAYNESFRIPKYNYMFLPDKDDSTFTSIDFKSTEIRLKGRYAYKEKFVQSFGQLLSDGTDYPVIYFAYTKGLDLNSPTAKYDYNKISLGIEKTFLIKNVGRTKLLLEGGYMQGNVPYSYLFNGNGSNTKGSYIYVENTFQTMRLYEFVSDRYVNLFFSHNFGSLLFKRPKFQPQFVIFTNVGFGTLKNKEQHSHLGFKTMEKGFYESGLLINNLVRINYYNIVYLGLGGGAFVRYGPYADTVADQMPVLKLSLVLTF